MLNDVSLVAAEAIDLARLRLQRIRVRKGVSSSEKNAKQTSVGIQCVVSTEGVARGDDLPSFSDEPGRAQPVVMPCDPAARWL